MNIQVKRLAEKEPLVLRVQVSDSVAEIKMLIQESLGIPPNAQQLILRKKELRNESASVEDCGLSEGTLLVLLVVQPDVRPDEITVVMDVLGQADSEKQLEVELHKQGLSISDLEHCGDAASMRLEITLSTGEVLDSSASEELLSRDDPPSGARLKATFPLRKPTATPTATLTEKPIVLPVAAADPEYDCLRKLLVVGDSGVGKSNFVLRFADDSFTDSFIPTIGVDFKIRSIPVDTKTFKLQIWDTSGQERFQSITNQYFRQGHAVIVMYDVCDRDSFANVDHWLSKVNMYGDANVRKILVGNKCDLESCREVTTDEGRTKAAELGIPFLETSAKEASNVEAVFQTMVK